MPPQEGAANQTPSTKACRLPILVDTNLWMLDLLDWKCLERAATNSMESIPLSGQHNFLQMV